MARYFSTVHLLTSYSTSVFPALSRHRHSLSIARLLTPYSRAREPAVVFLYFRWEGQVSTHEVWERDQNLGSRLVLKKHSQDSWPEYFLLKEKQQHSSAIQWCKINSKHWSYKKTITEACLHLDTSHHGVSLKTWPHQISYSNRVVLRGHPLFLV